MLEILKFIDRVCAENHIRYWLSSGTALGAVRHGGFIPWDDDVDIELLEPDFRRLKKVWRALDNPPFVWQDSSTDPAYVNPNPKIRDLQTDIEEVDHRGAQLRYRGLFVDVFHIRPSRSVKLDKAANLFQKHIVRELAARQSRLTPCALWLFRRVITPVTDLLQGGCPAQTLRHAPGSLFTKPRCRADVAETVRIPFEGVLLPVPKGYDHYLRLIYGDYMQVPKSFHTHLKS